MPRHLARVAMLFSLLAFVACSTSSPTDPEDDGGGDPTPNPDGVLLEGSGADIARGALTALPPSAVSTSEIAGELITTRLTAMIGANATVAGVNAALESNDARIVTMNQGNPFVTLKVSAVAEPAEARALSAALLTSGAFTYVAPAHVVRVTPIRTPAIETVSIDQGLARRAASVAALNYAHVLPAWNVAKLGLANQDRIVVLMLDEYASASRHQEIDAQQMIGFGNANFLPGPAIYPGNTGFVSAGVVGANIDETAPTGASPYPIELLDIRSMPVGGMTWNDIIWSLAWQLASSGNEFVLHSALEYNDPDFVTFSKLERAMQVIAWRVAAATHYDKFVHVLPAPGIGEEAGTQSPFLAAAVFEDVRDMVDLDQLSEADALAIQTAWTDLSQNFPLAAQSAPNVITVASVNPNTGLSSFSGEGTVRAPGEFVVGPCVSQDPEWSEGQLCDGDIAIYSGNSLAAAHVTGLAAYMMSLTDATPAEIRERIVSTAQVRGVIDGFAAVLALDTATERPIREALLDVASFESTLEDGKFDQWDLQAITTLDRAPSDVRDLVPRGDFNGDMQVGETAAAFDLNNDGVYGMVSQTIEGQPVVFDEHAVRDIDVVCYYAYSNVYRGDLTVRGQYLTAPHSGLVLEVLDVPRRIAVPSSFDIRYRAGLRGAEGAITYVAGISISTDIDGGNATPSGGVTDDNGVFTTTVTIDDDTNNEFSFGAWAETGDLELFARVNATRENEIVLHVRSSYVSAGVYASYNPDVGVPEERFISEFVFEEASGFGPVDVTLSRNDSGTGAGISVTGMATAHGTSRVDLSTGDQLHGFYVTSRESASLTLTNPNFDVLSYLADVTAETYASIEFAVWGDPATFTLQGSTGDGEYDVDLDGDRQVFECDSSDSPCTTISSSGILEPGFYRLSVDYLNQQRIRWFDGCTDCAPTQGTLDSSGNLSVNFEISHGGSARTSGPSYEGRSTRFEPRERSRHAQPEHLPDHARTLKTARADTFNE